MKAYNQSSWWKNLCICFFALASVCMVSCDDEENTADPYFTIEGGQTSFEGTSDKAEYTVTIRSNRSWRIVSKTENTEWARPFPDEGDKDGRFKFIVKANDTFDSRKAEFAILIDNEEYPVLLTVGQGAAVPSIVVGDGTGIVKAASDGGTLAVTSQSNVEWTCVVDEAAAGWLSVESVTEEGMINLQLAQNQGVERTGILHCVSEEQPSANIDIQVVQAAGSVLIQEDFSWLSYGSSIHYETTGETRYDNWTDEERAHGWYSTPVSESSDQPLLYARQGFVKLGKTNYAGDLISPKLNLSGTADVVVTFKACAYISEGGTKDDNELYVSVIGPGTVEVESNPLIIDNYPNSSNNENGADYNVWDPAIAERSFIVRGATSETQIKFMGGKSYNLSGIGKKKNRIFLDDITVEIME